MTEKQQEQEMNSKEEVFVRLFVNVYEDPDDTEQGEDSTWKNYDGYHFIAPFTKSNKPKDQIDPSKEFRNTLKYAFNVPAHLISNLEELVEYLCKAFQIKDPENYTLMKNQCTLLFDLSKIRQDDSIKLIKKDKLIKVSRMEEEISKCQDIMASFNKEYLKFVQKHPFILSLPKEWKSLETVDLSASKEDSEKSITSKIIDAPKPPKRLPRILQNLHQRVSVFEYGNELFYETPAFKEFMDECSNCTTREQLQMKIKILSEMRGFKVVQPQGEVINQKREFKNVFHCIKSGKNRKGSINQRTGCPFTLIYQKAPGCLTYSLTKFRGSHNHQLDDFPDDYKDLKPADLPNPSNGYMTDPSMNRAMTIKHDDNYSHELKTEDSIKDYSLGEFPQNALRYPIKSFDPSFRPINGPYGPQNNLADKENIEMKTEYGTQNTEGYHMRDVLMR